MGSLMDTAPQSDHYVTRLTAVSVMWSHKRVNRGKSSSFCMWNFAGGAAAGRECGRRGRGCDLFLTTRC